MHLCSPGGWINDPNGFIYYKGLYHLFYQYFPYDVKWGTMRWGHAVSTNLTDWKHIGVAVFPTKYEDSDGCFSGCAVEDKDGNMNLFYTGVHYTKRNRDNIHEYPKTGVEAVQMKITSDDGIRFDNFTDKSIAVPKISADEPGDRSDTRDPLVFKGKNAWYMLLGSTYKHKTGQLLIYESMDLKHFALKSYIKDTKKHLGWMWECPDYFTLNGKKDGVLIVSAIGMSDGSCGNLQQTVCMQARFDENNGCMKYDDSYQFIDYGMDLYATQTAADECGRRTLIAWMRMPAAVDGRWIGMFCYPRIVSIKNEHIYFSLHPEVKNKFSRKINTIAQADGREYMIHIHLADSEYADIGGYRIENKNGCIVCDRTGTVTSECGHKICRTPALNDGNDISVYVSQHLIETFVNDGEYVISNVVYNVTDTFRTVAAEKPDIFTVK